jgi:hypothetical protein
LTPDSTPPVISGVSTTAITQTSATVSWTTDEASDSQISYGIDANYGSSTTLNSALVTSHSQNLTGLTAGTTYHYQVKSKDASGNLGASLDSTFTTQAPDTTPPTITGVNYSNVTSSGATIAWTTDEASDTQIEYGLTASYGSSTTLNASLVVSHSQNLTGLSANTLYHFRVKSKDAAGNLATSIDSTFTTQAAPTTQSLWNDATVPAVPADADTSSVELGTKFRSTVAGYVKGVRFYKGSGNTGTHTGALWNKTGTKLAQVTFTNETATGWQTAMFTSSVAVAANTTYIISYHAPVGRYAENDAYFATAAFTNGTLSGLKNGTDGGNGVYKYSSTVVFPNLTYNSNNYWVDVVFSTTP